jgi:branched-subunit amino acid transport protein
MQENVLILCIVLMTLVTVIPRILPLMVLGEKPLPPVVQSFLRYVPTALLASVLAQEILFKKESLHLSLNNLYLWALLPTAWIALRSRNLAITVAAGIACLAICRFVGGS